MPRAIHPELATLIDRPPEGSKWLHEIKFDGYRFITYKENNHVRLMTRNQNDWTKKFLSIAHAIESLDVKNIIFDGELVVLDENHKSNFQMLQNALEENNDTEFYYYIFDLLYYDQYDLRTLPLLQRKKYLEEILTTINHPYLCYSDHITGNGEKVFKNSCELGLEGIISKNAESPYTQKRTRDWLKIKCIKRQEFIIAGFTQPKGARQYFGSLLLATYDGDELIYHGNVGTGFTATSLKSIYEKLKQFKTNRMPFQSKPPLRGEITWIKPKLIAEVEFTEWTKDGSVRHPSFKGLRSDKSPKAISKEIENPVKKGDAMTAIISNPNKILYAEDEISKGDIAAYYEEVQDWILPYIKNRPLTLVRCPNGYEHCFYQKHISSHSKYIHPIKIKDKTSNEPYFYIDDSNGLFELVQMGTLEYHPWGSTIKNVEHPDIMIFDLDPAPGIRWQTIVAAAKELKDILHDYNLKSFVKTTGGKGLHVVVPLEPQYDWEQVKLFSHALVNYMVMQAPKKYVSKMSKAKRVGKIFIDYLRNSRGATAICPYSTRARIHAPVSVPLAWDELTNNFKHTHYTIKNLPERLAKLKKDPWKDFFNIKQSLRLDDLE